MIIPNVVRVLLGHYIFSGSLAFVSKQDGGRGMSKPSGTGESSGVDSERRLFADLGLRWARVFEEVAAAKAGLSNYNQDQLDYIHLLMSGRLVFSNATKMEVIEIGQDASKLDWSGGQRNHQEWRAQFNRNFHIGELTELYLGTNDEKYATLAAAHIESWIDAQAESYKLAAYDNQLNLALRLGTTSWPGWLGCLPFLKTSPAFDETLVAKIKRSAADQLNYLLQKGVTLTGNQRIAEADALALSGLLLSGQNTDNEWTQYGARIINEAFIRQFTPDGAHVERVPAYHRWMSRVFGAYWKAGRLFPKLKFRISDALYTRILLYGLSTRDPGGAIYGMHDSDSPSRASQEEGIVEYLRVRSNRHAELEPSELVQFGELLGVDFAQIVPKHIFFPDAGQIFLRSGHEPKDAYLNFDATNWGGGHNHLSHNNIEYGAFGVRMLRDPGVLSYEVTEPLMAHAKATVAHNTVNLNGWSQNYVDPVKTQMLPVGDAVLVASKYQGGYWPLEFDWKFRMLEQSMIPAEHFRAVLWAEGKYALVLDSVHLLKFGFNVKRPISVAANWQFDVSEVTLDPQTRTAMFDFEQARMHVHVAEAPEGAEMTVAAGEMDPPRGWLAAAQGPVPAPQLSIETAEIQGDYAEFCTVLMPTPGGEESPIERVEFSRPDEFYTMQVDIYWKAGGHESFRWTYQLMPALGVVDDLYTDGLAIRRVYDADGALQRGQIFGGTMVDAGEESPLYSLE